MDTYHVTHEEVFTLRYCRYPFIFAFRFHVSETLGVGDVLIQKRCTAKRFFTQLYLLRKLRLSQKILYLHQPTLATIRFSYRTLYALLITSKGQNTAI